MERGKIVAIITGAISLVLAIAYLLLVQLLDLRGEMIPAPQSQLPQKVEIAAAYSIQMSPLNHQRFVKGEGEQDKKTLASYYPFKR
jgi:hypothetical protein